MTSGQHVAPAPARMRLPLHAPSASIGLRHTQVCLRCPLGRSSAASPKLTLPMRLGSGGGGTMLAACPGLRERYSLFPLHWGIIGEGSALEQSQPTIIVTLEDSVAGKQKAGDALIAHRRYARRPSHRKRLGPSPSTVQVAPLTCAHLCSLLLTVHEGRNITKALMHLAFVTQGEQERAQGIKPVGLCKTSLRSRQPTRRFRVDKQERLG
jgi:hypothetical protein